MGTDEASEAVRNAATSAYSSSATGAPSTVKPTATVTINASVKVASTQSTLIDVEVYSPSGAKVAQKYWDKQALTGGKTYAYSLTWAVPSSATLGTYKIEVGVFKPNWGATLNWNSAAGTFVVSNSPPVVDAGTPPHDAGTPVHDAGTPVVDAGTPVHDAGTPVVDAGTPVGSCSEQTTWRATSGFAPLSDAQAVARICVKAEVRPLNASANAYLPSSAELSAFRAVKDNNGQTPVQGNPYTANVTGGCAASGRSTDEIIQCTAAKWGIPADWLRAEYVVESNWQHIDTGTHQPEMGDKVNVGTTEAALYPSFSRETSNGSLTGNVWQSLGLTQVRWTPTGTVGAGTEPLRWQSTAFNADYQAATVRFYYDNPQGLRSGWGDAYSAGNQWLSIGGWFNPYPWNNSGQQQYVSEVQSNLANRTWEKSGF